MNNISYINMPRLVQLYMLSEQRNLQMKCELQSAFIRAWNQLLSAESRLSICPPAEKYDAGIDAYLAGIRYDMCLDDFYTALPEG